MLFAARNGWSLVVSRVAARDISETGMGYGCYGYLGTGMVKYSEMYDILTIL